ncbi:hypothetical protein L2Z53_00365 [Macrococcoides canis]|uniref:hypothetical protein n=1 Tax=Macrococcoides canis TaxID=1855823 RepID=UPI001F2E8C0A|nr:hypothetical protein [Macrococcus canis]UJS27847.1 hypothetical protein L2Z53_00365 [Macrococcus canis]
MNEIIEKFIFDLDNAFYEHEGKRYCHSVHYKSYTRFQKAKEQLTLPTVGVEKIQEYVLEFLSKIDIKPTKNPKMNLTVVDYKKIKNDYSLKNEKDIVWMKFTKSGYLGVVAVSNDINFDIPNNTSEYNLKIEVWDPYKKCKKSEWKHNSSGIIIHKLREQWDDSFVLVFPLKNIPYGYCRHDIEKAIGNYLIKKNVPILDFYSHIY